MARLGHGHGMTRAPAEAPQTVTDKGRIDDAVLAIAKFLGVAAAREFCASHDNEEHEDDAQDDQEQA